MAETSVTPSVTPETPRRKPHRGRGRPPHEPTAKLRSRVALVAGAGWSQDEIAKLLDIDRETLAKYYGHELTVGAHEKREAIIEAMYLLGLGGNVSAARLYMTQTRTEVAAPAAPSEIVTAVPDGIKAARDRAAVTAQEGSSWSDVLPRVTPLQ